MDSRVVTGATQHTPALSPSGQVLHLNSSSQQVRNHFEEHRVVERKTSAVAHGHEWQLLLRRPANVASHRTLLVFRTDNQKLRFAL